MVPELVLLPEPELPELLLVQMLRQPSSSTAYATPFTVILYFFISNNSFPIISIINRESSAFDAVFSRCVNHRVVSLESLWIFLTTRFLCLLRSDTLRSLLR